MSYHLQYRPQKGRKTYTQLEKVKAANQAGAVLCCDAMGQFLTQLKEGERAQLAPRHSDAPDWIYSR